MNYDDLPIETWNRGSSFVRIFVIESYYIFRISNRHDVLKLLKKRILVGEGGRNFCEMTGFSFEKLLKEKIPILKWLPLYKTKDALGDLVAGLTVGLTLIPQVFS